MSKQTLVTARERLAKRKLISFTNGITRFQPSKYSLLELTDDLLLHLTEDLSLNNKEVDKDKEIIYQRMQEEQTLLSLDILAERLSADTEWQGKVREYLREKHTDNIPMIFRLSFQKIFSRYQSIELCNENNYRNSLRQRFIAIDDFGIEGTFYGYGSPHIVFPEIVDGIEKRGTLLIANTNLTLEEIKAKYGLRIFDRLRANMCIVVIREKSLRGKYKKRLSNLLLKK